MNALAPYVTAFWWLGFCFAIVGIVVAFAWLVELLTDESVEARAVTRKNRGDGAVPSNGPAIKSHIAHDKERF